MIRHLLIATFLLAGCGKWGNSDSVQKGTVTNPSVRIGEIINLESPRNLTYAEIATVGSVCNAYRALQDAITAGTSRFIKPPQPGVLPQTMYFAAKVADCNNVYLQGLVQKGYQATQPPSYTRVSGDISSYAGMTDTENDLTGAIKEFCGCGNGTCYGINTAAKEVIEITPKVTYRQIILNPSCPADQVCYQIITSERMAASVYRVTAKTEIQAYTSLARAGTLYSRIATSACTSNPNDLRASSLSETMDLARSTGF